MRRLTERQRDMKLIFCLIMTAMNILLAVWGVMWLLAALADGVLSVLHLGATIIGMLMARTFWRIADRT